jgi:DNA-binding CsgD family transcriptional regulator
LWYLLLSLYAYGTFWHILDVRKVQHSINLQHPDNLDFFLVCSTSLTIVMSASKLNHPVYYSLSNTCITNLYDKGVHGYIIDYNNQHPESGTNIEKATGIFTDSEIIILKCYFPSVFVLDIIYFIITFSPKKRILLSIEQITSEGLKFLKRVGLNGLLSDDPALLKYYPCTTMIKNVSGHLESIELLVQLSLIEIEILYLISIGMNNPQISDFMNRSYHTTKNHKLNIVRKLGLDHTYDILEFVNTLKRSPL